MILYRCQVFNFTRKELIILRMLPFFKPKKGFQFAGSGLDAGSGGGGGGGGSIDTSALANKTDLTAIILTGTTNTSGNVISVGTWFYLNGKPCVAKVDIASGATFTEGTNYEEKTIGSALTELNSNTPTVTSRYLISGQTIQIDLPSIYGTEKNVLLLFNHPYWSVPAMYLVCTGGDQVPAKIYDNNNNMITFTRSGTTFNVTYTEPSSGWSRVLMTTLG